MPSTMAGRLDTIQATLGALRHERARVERLGFEFPQARCHAELRYWSFLAAIHSLSADGGPTSLTRDPAWPGPPAR